MKSNPGKWDLFVSSCEKIKMEIGNFEIENITCEKLLLASSFWLSYIMAMSTNW